MSDDDFAPELDRASKCKAQFTQAVLAVVEEESPSLAVSCVSKEAAHQIAELAWDWTVTSLAPDLERFVQHRGRGLVGTEDVALAARRNPLTKRLIEAEARRIKRAKADSKAEGRCQG
uniref:Centromere protein S n=1 Tax=Chrysotila carterae TaxID=13221 RepID=A0A7S4C142_CHRCT|mmetsp:Transcript_22578/g.47516  ORF Transcript_22578/g.47516 Transcript_22578/m.47516 type:complete len:118 (-) Transcript_22578:140-493(-)